MRGNDNKEIEARFLEIDPTAIKNRLNELGAKDIEEGILDEVIFYDNELKWKDSGKKFVRLRKNKGAVFLTYKYVETESVDGTEEIEVGVSDMDNVAKILESIGLVAYRHQQKKRHSFRLDNVMIEIDTWPRIPTYVELEGDTEEQIRDVAEKLNLDWKNVTFQSARTIIENKYKIPVSEMKWFTFGRFE